MSHFTILTGVQIKGLQWAVMDLARMLLSLVSSCISQLFQCHTNFSRHYSLARMFSKKHWKNKILEYQKISQSTSQTAQKKPAFTQWVRLNKLSSMYLNFKCNKVFILWWATDEALGCTIDLPADCNEVFNRGERNSGVYPIKTNQSEPFNVYCDITAGEIPKQSSHHLCVFQNDNTHPAYIHSVWYQSTLRLTEANPGTRHKQVR